jgi:dienelactone hydrolase
MLVDLVQITTRDGLRLDGAFLAPPADTRPIFDLDAVCFVHGTGGNFYSSTLFDDLAGPFLEGGCAVLRVNTRGRDGISTAATTRGGRRLGAAYELVDDCRHDLASWLDWLGSRVGPRVGLVGHSLGAVKCLYALAHEPALAAACVAALSPPRLSYSWFCTSPEGPEFLETYTAAVRLTAAGQGSTLLEVRLPLPLAIAAAGYEEKYGPEEHYNILRFAARVPCPVLVTLGSVEVPSNMAFRGLPEALAETASRHKRMRIVTIPGADHFYGGVRGELIAALRDWLRAPGSQSPPSS